MLTGEKVEAMTLWTAYLRANQRRAALRVRLLDGQGLGNGRSERALRVSAHRVNGAVAVQQGLTADWIFVPEYQARTVEVERDTN